MTSYLTEGNATFWRWRAGGEGVEWTDGVAIASTAEIAAALERLAVRGLPAFSHVVLILAACEPSWRERIRARGPLSEHVGALVAAMGARSGIAAALEARVREGLARLEAVCELPYDLRAGAAARAVIAEAALERAALEVPAGAADAVLDGLRHGDAAAAAEAPSAGGPGLRELLALLEAVGHDELSADRLRLRARTGVGAVPEALDPLVAPEAVRALLQELAGDPDLGGLAANAQDLSARLLVPRAPGAPDPLPVGGYSDLSHRGPLDRLLVSELAHDPDALALRLALEEALFLARELPARQPGSRRALLLDAGVRTWGTPRLVITAAALALAAGTPAGYTLAARRVAGPSDAPVDLARREGVAAWLEELHADPHPGEAVARRLAAARTTDEQCVLFTHAATLADPAFRARVAPGEGRELLVIAVATGAPIEIVALGTRGARSVARVDTPSARPAPGGRSAAGPRVRGEPLPAILFARPFPLPLPHDPAPRLACWSRSRGCAAITRDGRLVYWARPNEGARELEGRLPAGQPLGMFFDDSGNIQLVLAGGGALSLLTAAPATTEVTRRRLAAEGGPVLAVVRLSGLVALVRANGLAAFDTASGAPVTAPLLVPAGTAWVRDRFYRGPEGWSALHHDGRAVRRVAVGPAPEAGVLFDRDGLDGPWAIGADGAAWSLAGGARVPADPLPGPATPAGISRDGHRVALRVAAPEGPEIYLLDLESGARKRIYDDPAYHLEPSRAPGAGHAGGRPLRRPVRAALALGETLALVTADDRLLVLAGGDQGTVLREEGRAWPGDRTPVPFVGCAGPPGAHFHLRVARFPDGSRALLDSRGLVHLVSADPGVPELTAVLVDGALSFRTSDGRAAAPSALRRFAERLP